MFVSQNLVFLTLKLWIRIQSYFKAKIVLSRTKSQKIGFLNYYNTAVLNSR